MIGKEEKEMTKKKRKTTEELLLSIPKPGYIPWSTPQVVYWLRWYIERNRWGFQLG